MHELRRYGKRKTKRVRRYLLRMALNNIYHSYIKHARTLFMSTMERGLIMFVYFIQSGKKGAIKIGRARSVEKRLAELQVGNQFKLRVIAQIECASLNEAVRLERKLHKKFKSQNIRGEWFQGNIKLQVSLR